MPNITDGVVADYKQGHHMRSKDVSGPNSVSWRGGRQKSGQYVAVRVGPRTTDLEHRVVARRAGLLTDESHVIHHRDRNPHNNDPSNLEPMSRSEHMHLHSTETWADPVIRQRRIDAIRRAALLRKQRHR